ncbi:MAG: DUF1080 domain-containing protein [Gemmataceae bacterium]
MVRLSLLVIHGLAFSALAFGQDAKPQPKPKPVAKPRIAINDPDAVKNERDFLVQGEYVGTETASGKAESKLAAQVIALGAGDFEIKQYHGGLPGDGWDGKAPQSVKATLAVKDRVLTLMVEEKGTSNAYAQIENGKMTSARFDLKKVRRESPTLGAKPPAGAIVLFEKAGDEAKWAGGNLVKLSDGTFLGIGEKTKKSFGAFTAHIEFRLPWMPNSRGQGRGNSGFYLQDRYEVQVLDSFGLKGLNNECGGIYTQHAPSVNMCYPPLSWQTYDVDFTPATFDASGKKVASARTTIKHNGVLIQDHVELKGPTGGGQPETSKPGPFQLQNHGDPVVYRNIWVVEKP